jgi:hypothetical protein
VDRVQLAETLVDVSNRNVVDSVVNEEGDSGEGGGLLSTVLSGGRAVSDGIVSVRPSSLHCLAASTYHALSGILNSREETTELSDQSTGSPETTSSVEECGDLSGSSAVSGGKTEEETVTKKRYQSDASIPTIPRTHSSFKSAGLMMGYLGFKEPPAYILLKISSERVSWLKG